MGRILLGVVTVVCAWVVTHPGLVQGSEGSPSYGAGAFWIVGFGGFSILLSYGAYRLGRRWASVVKPGGYVAIAMLMPYLFIFAMFLLAGRQDPRVLHDLLVWCGGITLFLLPEGLALWLFHRHHMKKPENERAGTVRNALIALALGTVFFFTFPFVQTAMQGSISADKMPEISTTEFKPDFPEK